jgi:hypothetical protein
VAEERDGVRWPGLVHVLITARDEASAYRVFDALVERFRGADPPCPGPAWPGLVVFSFLTPTLGPGER